MVVTNYNAPEDGAEWEMSSLTDNIDLLFQGRVDHFSVLNQNAFSPKGVIFIDDNSTDSSLEKVKKFKKKIKLIKTKKKNNISKFNTN